MTALHQFRQCPRPGCGRMIESWEENCPFCGTYTPTPRSTPLPLPAGFASPAAYSPYPYWPGGYPPVAPYAWPPPPWNANPFGQPGVVSSTAKCPRCGHYSFTNVCGECGYSLEGVEREMPYARPPTPGGQPKPWEKEKDKEKKEPKKKRPQQAHVWERMNDEEKKDKRDSPYRPYTAYDILNSPMPPPIMPAWTRSPSGARAPLPVAVETADSRFSRVRTQPPTPTRAAVRGVTPVPLGVPVASLRPPAPSRVNTAPASTPAPAPAIIPKYERTGRRRRSSSVERGTPAATQAAAAAPAAPMPARTENGPPVAGTGRAARRRSMPAPTQPSAQTRAPAPSRVDTAAPAQAQAPPTRARNRTRRASFNEDPVASVRVLETGELPERPPSREGRFHRVKSILRRRGPNGQDAEWTDESDPEEDTALQTVGNNNNPRINYGELLPASVSSRPSETPAAQNWEFVMPIFSLPIVPIRRPHEPFDEILDGELEHVMHPAGPEALVYPTGAPTPKLRHLVEAMYLWIIAESRAEAHHYISFERLKLLEHSANNWGITYTYHEPALSDVYQFFGLEHAMIGPEPVLTFKGLLRYFTLWILCDPRFVCPILRSITRKPGFKPPMKQWKGGAWKIDSSMTLSGPHPDAIRWRTQMHNTVVERGGVIEARRLMPAWVMPGQGP